jgi:hypothetical protein
MYVCICVGCITNCFRKDYQKELTKVRGPVRIGGYIFADVYIRQILYPKRVQSMSFVSVVLRTRKRLTLKDVAAIKGFKKRINLLNICGIVLKI